MRKNFYIASFLILCFLSSSVSFANVTLDFSVDMANEEVSNVVNILWVYDLNDQNPNIVALTKNGTVYSTSISFDENSTVYYAFINGPFVGVTSKFEYVDDACAYTDQPGARTRSIETGTSNMTVPTVCFGACGACASLIDTKFSVDMAVLGAELANNVTLYVTKDFSAIPDFLPMTNIEGTTVWEATAQLNENEEYFYVFLNGDPNSQLFSMEDDLEKGFGLANCGTEIGSNVYARTLKTTASSMDIPTVCYGLCGDCSTNLSVDVSVDMEGVEMNEKSVFVKYFVSDFVNGTVELTKNATTNVWDGTIPSPSGVKLAYTFSVGNPDTDGVVETLNGLECNFTLGADNYRIVDMVDENVALPVVCYSTCSACVDTYTQETELDAEISIFPNPLSTELNISIAGDHPVFYQIEVMNTVGITISSDLFETSVGRFNKDVSSFAKGLYFVKISTKEGATIKKFIKG